MKKIVTVGSSEAGKSTFAQALGAFLDIEVNVRKRQRIRSSLNFRTGHSDKHDVFGNTYNRSMRKAKVVVGYCTYYYLFVCSEEMPVGPGKQYWHSPTVWRNTVGKKPEPPSNYSIDRQPNPLLLGNSSQSDDFDSSNHVPQKHEVVSLHCSAEEQKDEKQRLQLRWLFAIILPIWTTGAIIGAIVLFYVTKSLYSFSLIGTLLLCIPLWPRLTNYLFPMDEKTFELEKMRIQVKADILKMQTEKLNKRV